MVINHLAFRRELTPRKLSYIPNARLIGKGGVGKTTIVNKLSKCSSERHVNVQNTHQEENVYDVVYDENRFVLIDTPATDIDERPHRDTGSEEIHTKRTVSATFVVIKYDSRFVRMLKVYFELEEFVPNDADRIVLMISHSDLSKTPEKDFKEICDLFEKECSNLMNIIFYSEQCEDIELAKLIYSCISNMAEVETDYVDKEEGSALIADQKAISDNHQSISKPHPTKCTSDRFIESALWAAVSTTAAAVFLGAIIYCWFKRTHPK